MSTPSTPPCSSRGACTFLWATTPSARGTCRPRAAFLGQNQQLAEEEEERKRQRTKAESTARKAKASTLSFALDDEKSLDVEKMNLDIPDPQAVETTIAPEPEPAAEKPAHGDVVVAGSGKSPSTGAANLEGEAAKENASDAKAKPAEETKAPAKAEEAAKPAKPAEPARNEAAPTGEGYYIQVLATSSELSAEKLVKDMKLQGLPAYKMSVRQNGKTLWRVRVGLFKTKAEAESASGLLMLNNFASKPIVSHQKASKK